MTLRALERFLPRVRALVVLQHVFVTERSGAHSTGEHLVPSVFAHLGADRDGRAERRRSLQRCLHHVHRLRRFLRLLLRRLTLPRDPVSAAAHHVVVVVIVVVVVVVGGGGGGGGDGLVVAASGRGFRAQRGRHGAGRVVERRRGRGGGRRCPTAEQRLMLPVQRRAGREGGVQRHGDTGGHQRRRSARREQLLRGEHGQACSRASHSGEHHLGRVVVQRR